jgi:hypothetical protein
VTRFLLAGIGAVLQVLVGVVVFVSTLMAPVWAVAALGTAWLAAALWAPPPRRVLSPMTTLRCAWRGLRVWRPWPLAPLVAAIGTGLLWVVVLSLGDALLGWTP